MSGQIEHCVVVVMIIANLIYYDLFTLDSNHPGNVSYLYSDAKYFIPISTPPLYSKLVARWSKEFSGAKYIVLTRLIAPL